MISMKLPMMNAKNAAPARIYTREITTSISLRGK
jgi:hypothetical protein